MAYSVGQAASLAGVTVRTLHHYDRIGLLQPQERSSGGYRVYGEADLERLAQIRYYRELGLALTSGERLEVFGDFRLEDYEEEVVARWGDTDAYAESNRRVASYTKADWIALRDEGAVISQAFVALIAAGAPADGVAAMDAAERHRQHLARWFYHCPSAMHRGLGQMYVDDARFTASIDAAGRGLAAYLRDAFAANADRTEAAV